ncbi:MAG: AMP-binding protein [Clostridia bacterium]
MNIFEQVQVNNASRLSSEAMTMRLEDGSSRSYTYGQMFDAIMRFCAVLERMHVGAGDRVAIIAESTPEWNILFLAIAKLKATSALIDASLEREALMALLQKSDVRCLIASPKIIEKLGDGLDMPVINLLCDPQAYLDAPALLAREATHDGNPEAASIIFSSGTTKTASGILHNHSSLIHSALMCMECNRLKTDDRFLAILPNSHIYGLMCQLVGPLLLGADICFIEGMSGAMLMGAFQAFHPALLPAVPKIYDVLKAQVLSKINAEPKTKQLFEKLFPVCLSIRKRTGLNLGKTLFKAIHDNFGGKLRILASAGAPLSNETCAFFYGVGFEMLGTYGATETSIPTIGNIVGHITTDTCGRPYPDIQVKIAENGEMLIKTPYRMIGYFRDEQATQDAFDEDGWFRTGDLGSIDEKGLVRILGRCKENIVLATGKKVAPDDLEAAYAGIQGVKELVICGIPVADGSCDEVHAFVVADAAQADSVLTQLKQHSARLSQNQKLAGIHFVDAIPKTSLQKPKRFLLKQMILQNQPMPAMPTDAGEAFDIPSVVCAAIARIAKTTTADFTPDTRLFEELSIDSLSTLNLACEIDEKCGVRVDHLLRRDMTVRELIDCVRSPDADENRAPTQLYPRLKRAFEYDVFCLIRNLFRGIYQVNVENDANLPENSGYIICANHVSNFDYLYLTLNFKKERFIRFCCMAKKELFNKTWISKFIANVCGMVPVDRSGSVAGAMSVMREMLTEKWGVLIHPEGTRSEDGKMGEFKNGAAVLAIEADVPVVPAYIKGGYEVYPRSRKLPQLFDWKRMRKYQVEVIYGTPILPKGRTADELMQAIEAAVVALSQQAAPMAA